ncbi:MAG: hypothetical protein CTY30_08900, partial [Methylocystis sp.]
MPTHRRLVIAAAETPFSLVSAGAREDGSAKALGGANKETPHAARDLFYRRRGLRARRPLHADR